MLLEDLRRSYKAPEVLDESGMTVFIVGEGSNLQS